MPSGNSAAGLVLIRLWKLTGESRWQALADRQLAFLAGSAGDYPSGHCFALLALMEALYPSRELVCASADTPPEGLREIAEQYRLYTLVKTRENAEQLAIWRAVHRVLSAAAGGNRFLPLPKRELRRAGNGPRPTGETALRPPSMNSRWLAGTWWVYGGHRPRRPYRANDQTDLQFSGRERCVKIPKRPAVHRHPGNMRQVVQKTKKERPAVFCRALLLLRSLNRGLSFWE